MKKEKIYNHLRKSWISPFPEEKVRCYWTDILVNQLFYPKDLLVIEKKLDLLPHIKLSKNKVPNRRVDIMCYSKDQKKGGLFPLLLIECKSGPIYESHFRQLYGYNDYVKSYYIALANEKKIFTCWYNHEKKRYEKIEFLPTYNELVSSL